MHNYARQLVLTTLSFIALGALIAAAMDIYSIHRARQDTETAHVFSDGKYKFTAMTARDIILRIATPEEFKAHLGTLGQGRKVAGFTMYERSPCVIYIPEGWEIASKDESGVAVWVDDEDANTLAHEILHCLRGKWHPPWGDILARINSNKYLLNKDNKP